MRKIIQICSNYNSELTNGESLFALCNDGSVWWSDATLDFGWKRLLDIPQDESKQTKQSVGD
ncbi:hypothetical protein ACLQ91_01865 [Avibacterium endocarditidis]|uniref:hypothetical protein n=1 Tax=Avibacterium endocarditidis TaxID=380674 RepID=UPI0039FC2590